MRIGVDCHILNGKYQGSRTYLTNLYRAVQQRTSAHEFVYLGDWRDSRPFGEHVPYVETGRDSRAKRLVYGLQSAAREERLDAVHVGYIAPLRLTCSSIVTLYDILFESHPEFFARGFVLRSKLLCRLSARRASQIHTISEFSKREIMTRYGIDEERIAVVPCGVDTETFHPRDRQQAVDRVQALLGMKDYILTVGRLEPRKNHLGLLAAYSQLKRWTETVPRLMIVGQPDFHDKPIYDAIERLSLADDVTILTDVDDRLLPEVYRAARLFIYPSFAEGFGLPPLEAMASGVPVITSNTTAIPEVVGNDAVLVNPDNVREIVDALENILLRPDRAAALSERGRRRAMQWTWENAADKYLGAINSLNRKQAKSAHIPGEVPHGTIAFCGTRGLPANYGGFETAVDQITQRFTQAGYHCEVFCRRTSATQELNEHEGRRLTYVDGHRSKRLDTFIAAIQTGFSLWKNRKRYRHVFWFNNANLPGILIAALAGIPTSVNTDGLEWRRAKWSWPFKIYYWLASFLVTRVCKNLIADSQGIQAYYRDTFHKITHFVPYGAPPLQSVEDENALAILKRYGLQPSRFFLQITRIEPDNLPLNVAKAFLDSIASKCGYQMVFVGYKEGTPYARRLVAYDGRGGVQVREAMYDAEVLQILRDNCFCYVHGNSVGGTNPALLEAMATTPRVIAIDGVFSREVLGDTGRYFDPEEITTALNNSLAMPEMRYEMRRRVRQRYAWDAVSQSYINLAEGRDADYSPAIEEYQDIRATRVAGMVG